MTNKKLAIVAAVITAFVFSLSVAYATGTESTSSTTEEEIVSNTDLLEETVVVTDNTTIDISEESIEAIVDAFNQEDEPVSYTVSFDTGIGSNISSQSSLDLNLPYLEADGYSFVGWFSDPYFINRFVSVADIDSDITLYAKWVEGSPVDLFMSTIFDSMTSIFANTAILFLISLMGLALVIGIIKIFVSTRF